MITSWLFALASIFLTGVSQTLLKMGAKKEERKNQFIGAYLNRYLIIAYGLFVVVTLFSVYALRDIPLKVFYSLTSLNLFIVMISSYFVLKEPVNREQVIGVALIVFGVIIFNM
jgi:multidrug transporter EmrE-like cation transporter